MIDKVINYIWLGDKKIPKFYLECMESWSKLQGFSVRKWAEDDFDIDSMPYVKMCLEKKLYAFAADYLKCWIIYNHGGIYMDCDIMVLQSFESCFDNLHDVFLAGRIAKNPPICNTKYISIADFMIGGIKGYPLFKYITDNLDSYTGGVVSLAGMLNSTIYEHYDEFKNIIPIPYECFDRDNCFIVAPDGTVDHVIDESLPLYTKHLFNATWALEYVKYYKNIAFTDEQLQSKRELLKKNLEY